MNKEEIIIKIPTYLVEKFLDKNQRFTKLEAYIYAKKNGAQNISLLARKFGWSRITVRRFLKETKITMEKEVINNHDKLPGSLTGKHKGIIDKNKYLDTSNSKAPNSCLKVDNKVVNKVDNQVINNHDKLSDKLITKDGEDKERESMRAIMNM